LKAILTIKKYSGLSNGGNLSHSWNHLKYLARTKTTPRYFTL